MYKMEEYSFKIEQEKMERYKNLTGRSNVVGYELGATYIRVMFKKTASVYSYSYNRAGMSHVENMKRLAVRGSGLNSYIQRCVKYLYD